MVFSQLVGVDSLVVLLALLLVSTVVGYVHHKRVKTPTAFLIADHNAHWYDFGASQIAYTIGIATGVAFLPAFAYRYGPVSIVITIVSWIVSLWAARVLNDNGIVRGYLRTSYGISGFIASNFSEGRGRKFIYVFSGAVIAVSYWCIFGLELVALKRIFEATFPGQSAVGILLLAFSLAILYVAMGGYLSSLRTDGFQSMFFIVVLAAFSFWIFPQLVGEAQGSSYGHVMSKMLTTPTQAVSVTEYASFALLFVVLGVGYLITSQDLWSRASAVSQRGGEGADVRNRRKGLAYSVVAVLPFASLCILGLLMHLIDPALGEGELEGTVGLLMRRYVGVAPVGLLLVSMVAIAISTADTALITSLQPLREVRPSWVASVGRCRVVLVVAGAMGLAFGFAFPGIISGILGVGSVSTAFLPLIIARMWNRGTRAWVGVTVLVTGAVIGIASGLIGGAAAESAPLLVFFLSLLVYPLLHALPRTKEAA